MHRKLRFGMIGGGRGAFIGAIHRAAAAMDGRAELVAGAFSSDPVRSRASGADLFLDPLRVYESYRQMAEAEAAMPPDRRLDFVVIVTPNDEHFEAARLFLESGFNVVCDKIATLDLAQARKLRTLVRRTGKVYAITYNYTGYPMVKQARELVRNGSLGKVRKVVVEYPQGWLAGALERTGQKQAAWRTDPKRCGAAGCMGDIGSHCENLVHYIAGLELEELCADLTTFVKGRRLDDDGNVLMHYRGGAKGVMHASQICIGDENSLNIRVYGTTSSLEWHQEHPNDLIVKHTDKPPQVWRRGNGYDGDEAKRFTRTPAGHPEGYHESFANLYRDIFRAIAAEVEGRPAPRGLDFPGIDEGVAGMAFIEAVVRSSRIGAKWVKLPAQ